MAQIVSFVAPDSETAVVEQHARHFAELLRRDPSRALMIDRWTTRALLALDDPTTTTQETRELILETFRLLHRTTTMRGST